ncbi:hypothetical protein QZH41_016793, partial [Actinostola sp. cb2023]
VQLNGENTDVMKYIACLENKDYGLHKQEHIEQDLISSAVEVILSDSPKVDVGFLNLKSVYEKRQTRVNRQSRQRILKSKVEMVATFEAQLQDITVMVERTPEARALCGDQCGQVILNVKMGKLEINKQYFSVDLDCVYLAHDGCTPVYKLSTVDASRRNKFHLAVCLEFIDSTRSNTFYSASFLLRSKKKIP